MLALQTVRGAYTRMTSSAGTSTVIINSLWSGWPCALRHGSACRSRRSAVNGRNVQEQSCN
eukprot:114859-Pleurochrysis_carterae.AAC.1